MINEYFEYEFSLRAGDIVFERTVLWYCFKYVELTDKNRMIIDHQICGSMHLCQIDLSIIASNL